MSLAMTKFSLILRLTIAFFLVNTTCFAGSKTLKLTFCCAPDNNLYCVLQACGYLCPRFDNAREAVEQADRETGVLILADGYPGLCTHVEPAVLNVAAEKHLRVYIEYPDAVPGLRFGKPREVEWERVVVTTDAFGESLPRFRILSVHRSSFLPAHADNPMLVIARVAGYDRAVFGLPESVSPLLFRQHNLLIATTKLSNFVSGRFSPCVAWKVLWEHILHILDPGCHAVINWSPIVRPAFGPDETMPRDFEARAFKVAADWYHKSHLLIHPAEEAEVHELLRRGTETRPAPVATSPAGDGSKGILEGYASTIMHDGKQMQRIPIRSDCQAEAAMVLSLDWLLNGSSVSRDVARNLLDYTFFTSGLHGRERGNPEHPAFGLIAWGNIAPAWEVANYSDDDARVVLASVIASACLKTDRWDENLMRILLANLRTTGTLGFRGDRIDMPQIEARGWRAYHDSQTINYSPHHESYLWACNIWAYKQTGYKVFIERTKTAIRMTMEGYPGKWRWKDSIERARMLLCLAWLVRVEDTPEHRQWLYRIADDLIARQDRSGAIKELFGGEPGGFHVPQSNEAYGTTETPLIQENGDPASDQLYTTPFALLGFHEAVAATGDKRLREAEDRLAEYLCRIQTRSEKFPYLNGTWYRAFDFRIWDYWAASGDIGWGAWSVESGWGTAWAAAVLALRLKGTSVWDLTAGSQIIRKFRPVQKQMSINKGDPWNR